MLITYMCFMALVSNSVYLGVTGFRVWVGCIKYSTKKGLKYSKKVQLSNFLSFYSFNKSSEHFLKTPQNWLPGCEFGTTASW